MDKINAVMLADAYHPLIDEAVLNVMNENENVPITYYRELYQWGELIKPLEGN